MRKNIIMVIAALLSVVSAFAQDNPPEYYHVAGGGYVTPAGYGGYGYNNGYGYNGDPKAQRIMAIAQGIGVLGSLFKKSPAEAQARAREREAQIEANSPVNQALADRIRTFTAQETQVSQAVAARTYAGAHLEYQGSATSDGGSQRGISLSGGQPVRMSLNRDYDYEEAASAPAPRRHRVVSMANRGGRRNSNTRETIARLRERYRGGNVDEPEVVEESSPEAAEETPPPAPRKRQRRASKPKVTEAAASSEGGRERAPW